VGGKLMNDSTNRVGDDLTPELSTFVSWSNDTFGASLAYTRQERNSGQSGVFTNSWSAYSGPWVDADFIEGVPFTPALTDPPGTPTILAGDVNIINEPIADDLGTPNVNEGQQTNLTPGIRYYHEDQQRKRDNSQITLQYRPMENLTATLDVTHAEQDLFLNGAEFSFWFGGGSFPATDVQFDGNDQVASPVYFWAENPNGNVRDIGITQNQGDVVNELDSTGLNLEFVASDNLSFELDVHHSESSSLPGNDDSIGSYFNIATGAQGVHSQGYDNSGDLPLLVGVFQDVHGDGSGSFGLVEDELDVRDVGSTVRQGWYSRAWGEIDQLRIDGDLKLSDTLSLDFGIETRDLEAIQKSSFLQETMEGSWGVATPGDVPPYMMDELNFASLFDGYSTSLGAEAQSFFDNAGAAAGGNGPQAEVFTQGFIAKDVKDLGKLLSFNNNLPWEPNPDDGVNRTITEEISAFYIQANYQMELGGKPLDIVGGVRYESTDVKSVGQVAPVTIGWQGDNDLVSQSGNAALAPVQSAVGDYTHTLPSLSLSLSLTEDLVARFGYSTTISRPSYNNQLVGINSVQPPNGGPSILARENNSNPLVVPTGIPQNPGIAQDGNADLNPLESDNIDLSLEWYFGESSYAAIGYFQKDVPNFVGTLVTDREVRDTDGNILTLDPTNGPRAEAAIAQLIANGDAVNQQNLFQMIAFQSIEGQGCTTTFGPGEDATNSASCGSPDPFNTYAYQGFAGGWEENVDLSPIASGPLADPVYIARVNSPIDTQSAKLDGWEVALQHFFGETGFGAQFNYTVVDGDIAFDITGAPGTTQFALTGLSDTYNIVGIYEDSGWSARLAYNWRDAFLVSPTDAGNEPRHTEEYTQLDLSVGYDVSDDFTVSFEGINLTGEDTRDYARTERQLLFLGIQGPRYALGARYTFN
jgi:TonB-dependent receptor